MMEAYGPPQGMEIFDYLLDQMNELPQGERPESIVDFVTYCREVLAVNQPVLCGFQPEGMTVTLQDGTELVLVPAVTAAPGAGRAQSLTKPPPARRPRPQFHDDSVKLTPRQPRQP